MSTASRRARIGAFAHVRIREGAALEHALALDPRNAPKAFVFDDSIQHEAWNDSDVPRAVLIVDTWNPLLSAAERDLVRELVAGVDAWYAVG